MKNCCVYLVSLVNKENTGGVVGRILQEKGCEVLVGDGTLHDEMLARCDALVPYKAKITEEVLAKAPHLKVVSKFGVGMDRIDIEACTKRGIVAVNTPLANCISVAEHAIALMMASSKMLYFTSRALHQDEPDWKTARTRQSVELYGKTLAVIGYGNIGKYVAKLAYGLGMRVLVWSRSLQSDQILEYGDVVSSLDDAIAQADFVTLHVAGSASTKHFFGERELRLMKPGAFLINTTRGFVVDEEALIRVLEEGSIRGAGLDVFDTEPMLPGNPLSRMDNVILTPHSGAHTPEGHSRAEELAAQNIIDVMEGRMPKSALNARELADRFPC
ncbi:MAG: hydroxyacid dehydrogenase [Lachnospiraceae bacterium]|nr:hydroxyacid dehydrogenase [Lachnospiraceae bacterium]